MNQLEPRGNAGNELRLLSLQMSVEILQSDERLGVQIRSAKDTGMFWLRDLSLPALGLALDRGQG